MKKSKNSAALAAYELEARRMVKAEMARREVSYKQLSILLEQRGVGISSQALTNRLSRGGFSFAFAMLLFSILKVEKLDLPRI